MSSFFELTAQARLTRLHKNSNILKLNAIIDWVQIEHVLIKHKVRYLKANSGRPNYPLLSMFKAVLLGQWHNLSDPALEDSLIIRTDFWLFCGFGDMELPDHTTLNRFRNWLIATKQLEELLAIINYQLGARGLKVSKAELAIVDATIIQTAGKTKRKTIVLEQENNTDDTKVEEDNSHLKFEPPSTDKDARWTQKAKKFHLGYKQHTLVDDEGFIEGITTTPANVHDIKEFANLVEKMQPEQTVLADKGYASSENRELLAKKNLKDGIMHKAVRNKELSKEQKQHNKVVQKSRYVVEQTFGTLKRKFKFNRASYFGLAKVNGQGLLKSICLNLLKACNKIRLDRIDPSKIEKLCKIS